MYGIDNVKTFEFLIGKELEFLVYGPYAITFQFEKGYQIAAESELHLIEVDTTDFEMTCHKITNCGPLLQLIGSSIIDISVEGSEKLYLHFSNGQKLMLKDDSDQYESFNISGPDIGIIVV